MRNRTLTTGALKALAPLGLICLLGLLAAAAPASAAPKLETTSYWSPTHLEPGGQGKIWVQLRNAGPDANSGAFTLRVDLPDGITYAGVTPGAHWSDAWGGTGYCAITAPGESTVTCNNPTVLPGFSSNIGFGTGGLLDPHNQVMLNVNVSQSASPGTLPLRVRVSGGGSPQSVEERTLRVSESPAPFGIHDFDSGHFSADGEPFTQAGGHPDHFRTYFRTNLDELFSGGGLGSAAVVAAGDGPRMLHAKTPPGFIGDPNATHKCSQRSFLSSSVDDAGACPHESQVGYAVIAVPIIGFVKSAIYNLEPPPTISAQFGFGTPAGPVTLNPRVRSDGEYELTTTVSNISQADILMSSEVVLWGEPSSPAHDDQRCASLNLPARACVGINESSLDQPTNVPHPFDGERRPFLSLPTNCFQDQVTSLTMDRWDRPAPSGNLSHSRWHRFETTSPTPTGCEALDFPASLDARPTTNLADSPTGLDVDLRIPQSSDPEGVATAHLKDAVVTLPEGMTLNPAGANGLAACSPAQIGLATPAGTVPPRFNEHDPSCPAASKIANATVTTPLLEDPLRGEVFLAAQGANPFNSTIALYIVIRGPGILVKLAGEARPNPASGRLQTLFTQNPQLPFSDLELDFFGGARAPLATPSDCGPHTTTSELTPWSAPASGPPASSSDSWSLAAGPGGASCPPSASQLPFSPRLEAGSAAPLAGAHSPFVLRLRRPDGQAAIGGLSLSLPPGLSGSLAGIPACPEAGLAKFAGRVNTPPGTGAAEIAAPSCPAASRLGGVVVGAGAGPAPLYVNGHAYLAGPYKGAPLSLVTIIPAVAGPFDLGAVMVRNAISLNPRSAQISVQSDELPTIVEGIPVKLGDLRVVVDRPGFTLNPTSCEPMRIAAAVASSAGHLVPLASRFQVGECGALGFKPRLALSLIGATKRGGKPRLRAVVRPRAGDANIARTAVTMPRSAFLAQENLKNICTRVQWAADACPPNSIYGRAIARTPLLDEPLTGTVHLRSSDNNLPDLVADLRGPAHLPIRIELVGRTDAVKGALRSTFEAVPDAPVSFFRLELFGGKKRGLIVNSRNLCATANRAAANLAAHNGRRHKLKPVVRNSCTRKQLRQAKRRQAAAKKKRQAAKKRRAQPGRR